MKRYLIICLFLIITPGCKPEDDPNTGTTIDYIRRTGRLWGVAGVILNENGSITLIDTKGSGDGFALTMRDPNQKAIDSMTLNPGRKCSLSDGRHAFITYEFKAIEQGRITIAVTDEFDARSFGNGIKRTKATVTISPYKKQQNP